MSIELPRVVVAGLAGDTGKTLVSMGLVRALDAIGRRVAPFKKGPDFIDAAWLGAAARAPGRNLDTFLMAPEAIRASVERAGKRANFAVIEGNRGLFDGMDAKGTHSTAALAKMIGAQLLLVVDASKATRTVAAQVAGCLAFDAELPLAGVILNRVGTARQEAIIREALATEVGVPVVGAIPRLDCPRLPDRHLGLVPFAEHPDAETTINRLSDDIRTAVDLSAIVSIAERAPSLPAVVDDAVPESGKRDVRIGVLRDRAFSFYYPENLEALQASGAELVEISPLSDTALPHIDALYAGGGFPEVYAEQLSANTTLHAALRKQISEGLPVWAECGGLIYLSRQLTNTDATLPMVGALPVDVVQKSSPQGHGYVQAHVDRANPFLSRDTKIRGHEFHYLQVEETSDDVYTILSLRRGVGIGDGRDGICVDNVVASFTHIHALATPSWAPAVVRAASGGTVRW